jgi:poly(A) polymerase
VGGFVRDTLLGRPTHDIDVAVPGDALGVAARLAQQSGGHFVPLDEANQMARVVLYEAPEEPPWQLDFSAVTGTLEDDMARRDFTVNAMAVNLQDLAADPANIRLVDPLGGLADLRQRRLRVPRPDAFRSDPARLLRAVRLSAALGLSVDAGTLELMKRDATLASSVAGERTREELVRLLAVPGMAPQIHLMDDTGLLTALIPELEESRGVTQPAEHHWDVHRHLLNTVAAAEFVLGQAPWPHTAAVTEIPRPPEVEAHFASEVSSGSTRGAMLKMSGLLHDIAKPRTKTIEETGRMRFFGHQLEGADAVAGILERLRFSTKEIKVVETSVRHHMRPTQMSNDGPPTGRAIYRFFRDAGDIGIDVLFLSLADHLAARGPGLIAQEWQKHVHVVEYMLAHYYQNKRTVRPVKLIDGNDLIKLFGMAPGPEIGRILEALRERQATGEIASRDEALAFVRQTIAGQSDLPMPHSSGEP